MHLGGMRTRISLLTPSVNLGLFCHSVRAFSGYSRCFETTHLSGFCHCIEALTSMKWLTQCNGIDWLRYSLYTDNGHYIWLKKVFLCWLNDFRWLSTILPVVDRLISPRNPHILPGTGMHCVHDAFNDETHCTHVVSFLASTAGSLLESL